MFRRPQETEFYVKRVIDFSSEYDPNGSYSARNIAGTYSIYPEYGDQINACVFRTYGSWWRKCPMNQAKHHFQDDQLYPVDQYIDLWFGGAIRISKVEVFETYNPGAIVGVQAAVFHENGVTGPLEWVTLWKSKTGPSLCPERSRIFCPPLLMLETPPAVYIRLELNCSISKYYTELDAVRVTGALAQNFPAKPKKILQSTYSVVDMMRGLHLGNALTENSTEVDQNALSLLERLHNSILCKIMSKLCLPDLSRLACVSRHLRLVVYDYMAVIRGEISLRYCWPVINDRCLAFLRQRFYDGSLRHFDLSWCGNYEQISVLGFRAFFEEGNVGLHLNTIHLSNCNWLTDDCLHTITLCCPQLKELDLSSCRGLSSFGLRQLQEFKWLEWLCLFNTLVTTEDLEDIFMNCLNLKHLNIDSCSNVHSLDEVLQIWAYHNSEAVQSLVLCRSKLTNIGGSILANHFHNLEELDLGWCPQELESALLPIIQNCCKLRKLFLTAVRVVTDEHLLAIAKHLLYLEQLDVLGTNATSYGARHVLSHCLKLYMFDLSFCETINVNEVNDLRQHFPLCDILI